MASFTSSSLCLHFQGTDCNNVVQHRFLNGRVSGSSILPFGDIGFHRFLVHKGSQAKHEIRGDKEHDSHRNFAWSTLRQTALPAVEFSRKPDSRVMLSTLASSRTLENPATVLEAGSVGHSSDEANFQERVSVTSLMGPVAEDLQTLNRNLQTVIGSGNPLLMAAAKQIFSAGGKRMRPALVLLASRATAELTGLKDVTVQHRQLAEVIEMIHTASLMHADVLDESVLQRGSKIIHQVYGTRVAVLVGDFMFAQSSWYLASLENLEVIKLISQVIKDFAIGEIKQASSLFDCDMTLQGYLNKSFYKTAFLIAASLRSAAIFSGASAEVRDKMFSYGMNLGLAFQFVDDILDFTRPTEELGRPAGSDLLKGILTAPVLFALEEESKLRRLIESEFRDDGSIEAAIELVLKSGGMERAHALAKQKGEEAKSNLDCLPQGLIRSSLEGMVDYALERLF